MPIYTVAKADLDRKVAEVEANGEHIIQVVGAGDRYKLLTRIPENDTGRPHLPSWEREKRPAS